MTSNRNDSRTTSSPGGTILPLIASNENRRLLTKLIDERYDVVSVESQSIRNVNFDLCIVDDQSLADHWQELAEIKESRPTPFLPYLLVTRRQDVEQSSQRVQEKVDEILTVPTTKAILAGRIENLLQRRRSEDRFRLLFQAAPDPVVVVSSDGVVSNANEAFIRTFGLDKQELGQVAFNDLGFSQPDSGGDSDADGPSHTVFWERDDGTTLFMELHVNPVKQNGTVLEWIGIFRDVTTSVKQIEELERDRQHLDGLHWSRT